MGIEPTFLAWEATFLPLEDTRAAAIVHEHGRPCGNPQRTFMRLLCKREAAC